jgi:hypothetical protein
MSAGLDVSDGGGEFMVYIYIYHEFILIDQLMGVQNQLIYLDTSRYIWMYNYLGISGYFWTIG